MRSRQWPTGADDESACTKARPSCLPADHTMVAGPAWPYVWASPAGLPMGSFLLAVQRRYGNQFAQRLVQPPSGQRPPGPVPGVQPMLRLGSPGDRFERQADLVARWVTSDWPERKMPLGVLPPGGDANRYAGPVSVARAPRDIIQPFWVLRYGEFSWRRADDSYKFFRLNNVTHSSRKYPDERPVFVEPWEKPGTNLQIAPTTHLRNARRRQKLLGKLTEDVILVLRKIHRTSIGSWLLRDLAAVAPEKTFIMPQKPGPDPTTTAYPGRSRIELEVKKVYDAWDFLASTEGRVEVDWRKMPSDVVLFHELVHAYHDAYHTEAQGRILDAEAQNEVDVGVNRREYQAVGLDALDGAFHYANERFTENKYRSARGGVLPRTTYMVPYTNEVPRARRSSLAAEDAADERSSDGE